MTQFSLAELFGMTIRESANDGSDFTNPSADYRRMFLGEDGNIHLKDSAGTVTDVGGASGSVATDAIWDAAGDLVQGTGANTAAKLTIGSARTHLASTGSAAAWETTPYAINRLGSGDVSITATTNVYASNLTGLGDITLACATGDLIEVGVQAIWPNTTNQSGKIDVCTVVSAAAVNFFSNGTGTGAANGVVGWYAAASVISKSSGSQYYVAQSGDISGGNIVLRCVVFVSGTRTVGASTATNPFTFWARNWR